MANASPVHDDEAARNDARGQHLPPPVDRLTEWQHLQREQEARFARGRARERRERRPVRGDMPSLTVDYINSMIAAALHEDRSALSPSFGLRLMNCSTKSTSMPSAS